MFARMPITNFNYHLRRFAFLSFPVLFLFYLRKRGNEITSIFLLISKEMMILFEKKFQCVYFLKSKGKINYRRFVNLLFHVETRHREKFPSQKKIRDREITRYSNYSNISFKFPLLPPPVFLRSLRQLKFVVSYPRFREIKFLTRRFWKGVTFEEQRETYRSFPAKYNFSLVF